MEKATEIQPAENEEAVKTEPASLGALLASIVPDPVVIRDLDLSEAMGKEAGTTIFSYRVPGVAEMYNINAWDVYVWRTHPSFTQELCRTIAIMAACHVSPPLGKSDPPPWSLYAGFVKNVRVWARLTSGFLELFPDLFPVPVPAKQARNRPARQKGNTDV